MSSAQKPVSEVGHLFFVGGILLAELTPCFDRVEALTEASKAIDALPPDIQKKTALSVTTIPSDGILPEGYQVRLYQRICTATRGEIVGSVIQCLKDNGVKFDDGKPDKPDWM